MCVNSRSMEQLLSEKREPCFCESTCGTVDKVSDTWLSHASGTGSILLILMWHWGDDISWSVTVRRVMSVQENGSQEEPCDLMASGLRGSGPSTEINKPLFANYKIFYLFTQSRLRSWYSPSSLWIPRRFILMIPLFLKIRDRGKFLYFKCVKGFLHRWIIPQNEVWNKK